MTNNLEVIVTVYCFIIVFVNIKIIIITMYFTIIVSFIIIILIVNAPRVMVENTSTPTLNEPLTIMCDASTMNGVDDGVTFVWDLTDENNDEVVFRTMPISNGNLNTDTNRLEFTDSFTIPMLNESHNDDMYKCTVTIDGANGDMVPGMANVSLEDLGIFGK